MPYNWNRSDRFCIGPVGVAIEGAEDGFHRSFVFSYGERYITQCDRLTLTVWLSRVKKVSEKFYVGGETSFLC